MSDRLLHWLTRAALRVMTPTDTLALVTRASRRLPRRAPMTPVHGGTCLSRSITRAASLPGARVAIGVRTSGFHSIGATRHGRSRRETIAAHAWVEVDGSPLPDEAPFGSVIAYLERLDHTASG